MKDHYRIWIVGLSFVPVVVFLLAIAIRALLDRVCASEGAQTAEPPPTYNRESLMQARRRGFEAVGRGAQRSSCPYHDVNAPLRDEWNTGYTLGLLKRRHGVGRIPEPQLSMNGRTNGRTEERTDADASTDRRGTAAIKSSGRRKDEA